MPQPTTSEIENKRIARALLEEVLNRRQVHRIPEFIAPDYQALHTPIKGKWRVLARGFRAWKSHAAAPVNDNEMSIDLITNRLLRSDPGENPRCLIKGSSGGKPADSFRDEANVIGGWLALTRSLS